jgi:hypothetical protein
VLQLETTKSRYRLAVPALLLHPVMMTTRSQTFGRGIVANIWAMRPARPERTALLPPLGGGDRRESRDGRARTREDRRQDPLLHPGDNYSYSSGSKS